jgi:hypothetical protein
LENHDRAKSRPKYPDGFANEFEMRLRIDGLLFPIGKICRRMTHFGQPLGTAQRPSRVPSPDLPNKITGSSGNRVDESNGKCGLKPHGYWVFEIS